MISILHPSRGRPEKSKETIDRWFQCASLIPYQWITSIDEDDPLKDKYLENGNCLVSKNRSAIDAINNAAKICKGEIMIVVSDDSECPDNWNSFLLQWLDGKSDFICKVQDGIQPWIITMPIMDRVYYNRFGYIYHPDYQHMFCDTELTCVADLLRRKLTSNVMFRHNKSNVPDPVSTKADATWNQGEKLFLERYKRNFNLPDDQIKGKIEGQDMINWLQRKAR